jgi:hypothetical protein
MAEPSERPTKPKRVSLVAHVLLFSAAAIAVLLAGGPQQGNLGAFLVVAGVALAVCPPQVRVDGKIWALGGGLVLAAALAFLPQAILPEPAWRQRLAAAHFPFSPWLTPVPRETAFWLAVLALAVCLLLFAWSHPMRSHAQLIAAGTAIGICGGYAALAHVVRLTGWEYPFDANPDDYGFFLNRNHTAAYLVTGSVLALGLLVVGFRGRHWVAGGLAAAGLGLCASGFFFHSTSRGGILAFVGGALLWLAGLGRVHRSRPLLVSFGSVFAAGLLLFLATPSAARKRTLITLGLARAPMPEGVAPVAAPSDARLHIFRDTLSMVRDYPLTGSGLGSFRWVFPFYRKSYLSDSPISHPESDWLMFAAEAGMPALLLLAGVVGWLVQRIRKLREHPYWPMRWSVLCAVLTALLHGFIDVPIHRTALGWWILALAGLGFQALPKEPRRPPRWQHALFIGAGIGSIALGVPLIASDFWGTRASPPQAAGREEVDVIALRFEGKMAEALATARGAIGRSPMADRLWFQLGVTLMQMGSPEADAALRMQRLLNPITPAVPLEQGTLWMETDPTRTAALWLEAMARRENIDQPTTHGETGALMLFTTLVLQTVPFPELQSLLLAGVEHRPNFVLSGLERVEPAVAAAAIARQVKDPIFLKNLPTTARERYLRIWYDRADRASLFAFAAERPDWESAVWPLRLRQLAEAGKYEEAVRAAAGHRGLNLTLPAPGAELLPGPPGNTGNAADAFLAAWRRGNTITARRILEEARQKPPVPAEVLRLLAALAVEEKRWPVAWMHLEAYLRAEAAREQ